MEEPGATHPVTEEHLELVRELRNLDVFLAFGERTADPAEWLLELAQRVLYLRPWLEAHFQWEEQIGFFECATRVGAGAFCEHVRRAHEDVLRGLADVAETARRIPLAVPLIADLVRRTRALIAELDGSERDEDAILHAILGSPDDGLSLAL